MRKRQKKKREIRAEIRHAEFMRGLERMHAIVRTHVSAVELQIRQSQKFINGGILPGSAKPVQINVKSVEDFIPNEKFQQIHDTCESLGQNMDKRVLEKIGAKPTGGIVQAPKTQLKRVGSEYVFENDIFGKPILSSGRFIEVFGHESQAK